VPLFIKAIELDPNYGRAHAALAASYWLGVGKGVFRRSKRQLAKEHLEFAMREPTPVAHRVASLILTYNGRHNEAIAEAESAIALDPNDPIGYFATNRALTYAGRPGEAIDYIKKAMRLNPHYPPVYLYRLGWAQFNLERYKDAAASLEESIFRDPDFVGPRGLLVATYGHLNRFPEAIAIYKGLSEKPDCSWYLDFKEVADQERWCNGLQKAGLQPQ
jgi:tetratricopeptide (TPR) repeat protein